MTSIRRALLYSFLERYFSVALALGSSVVLARLLSPEEFGIYSVALALIGMAHVLRDFGIANYLIQEPKLTDAHIRTALSIALLIGWSLFGLILFVAPWVGSFYDERRISDVLQIASLNFAILPLCTISLALLRREMQFKQLMLIQCGSALINTTVTLVLAWSDAGPLSMAWGSVAGHAATGCGAWWARSERRLLWPGWEHWRSVLRFGSQNASAGLVTAVAMDINDLVVGKVIGLAPVAVLSRAQGLMNLCHRDAMGAVRQVAYPVFCRAHREGHDLEALHLRSVALLTSIGWPFYGFVSLHASAIVSLLYGPQWEEAAALVPLFCLAGASVLHAGLVLSVITAVGRNDLVARVEIVFQSFRAGVIVIAAVGWQSIWACAVAFVLAHAAQAPALYAVKSRCLAHDARGLMQALSSSAWVSLGCLLPPVLIVYATAGAPWIHPWALLMLSAGVALLSWGVTIRGLNHPMAQEPMFRRVFGPR